MNSSPNYKNKITKDCENNYQNTSEFTIKHIISNNFQFSSNKIAYFIDKLDFFSEYVNHKWSWLIELI